MACIVWTAIKCVHATSAEQPSNHHPPARPPTHAFILGSQGIQRLPVTHERNGLHTLPAAQRQARGRTSNERQCMHMGVHASPMHPAPNLLLRIDSLHRKPATACANRPPSLDLVLPGNDVCI